MQVGGVIPVSFQLYDCATDKFVRAWVREPNGDLVGGTFVNLAQVALGIYQDYTLTLPNVPFVTVQYVVYDDAGYTQISGNEGAGSDTIYRDPSSSGGGGDSSFTCFLTGVIDGDTPCAPNGIQDVIVKGGKRTLTVQLQRADSEQPFNLADAQTLTCRFLNADRTVLEISSDDVTTPIEITNPGGGIFTCAMTAEQSALLMAQTPAAFAVVVELSTGDVVCNFPYQLSVVDQAV